MVARHDAETVASCDAEAVAKSLAEMVARYDAETVASCDAEAVARCHAETVARSNPSVKSIRHCCKQQLLAEEGRSVAQEARR